MVIKASPSMDNIFINHSQIVKMLSLLELAFITMYLKLLDQQE